MRMSDDVHSKLVGTPHPVLPPVVAVPPVPTVPPVAAPQESRAPPVAAPPVALPPVGAPPGYRRDPTRSAAGGATPVIAGAASLGRGASGASRVRVLGASTGDRARSGQPEQECHTSRHGTSVAPWARIPLQMDLWSENGRFDQRCRARISRSCPAPVVPFSLYFVHFGTMRYWQTQR